jgi:N-acetylglutamate synthase-like GNAT family acetyltransferase
MARVVIRQADERDSDAIHALLLVAFTPFRAQYTEGCFDATVLDPTRVAARMAEGPVYVAEQGGTIVGSIGVNLDRRGAYVRGLAVHPAARRAGAGRQLLDACEIWATEQGARAIWLSTTLFLAGSISLYQRSGYDDAPGPDDLRGTPLRSFEKPLRTD